MMFYEGKKLSVREIATLPTRVGVDGRVEKAGYFLLNSDLREPSGPFEKSELIKEIKNRNLTDADEWFIKLANTKN